MAKTTLADFINEHRDELIGFCRAKVAARSSPPPTAADIEQGIPLLLSQLAEELSRGVPRNTAISAEDFRTLNLCLDVAIAGAVTECHREPRQHPRRGAC